MIFFSMSGSHSRPNSAIAPLQSSSDFWTICRKMRLTPERFDNAGTFRKDPMCRISSGGRIENLSIVGKFLRNKILSGKFVIYNLEPIQLSTLESDFLNHSDLISFCNIDIYSIYNSISPDCQKIKKSKTRMNLIDYSEFIHF